MSQSARIAFLIPFLTRTGGINVVAEHALRLRRDHGYDVTLILAHGEAPAHCELAEFTGAPVIDLDAGARLDIDLAIATYWETVPRLSVLTAERMAYFTQSLEDRFFHPDQAERQLARLTYSLGLPLITEATWIAESLRAVVPDDQIHLVLNGIDAEVFGPIPDVPPALDGPLRILIDAGGAWYKGLEDSLDAVAEMRCDRIVSVISGFERRADPAGRVDRVHSPMPQHELAAVYRSNHLILKHSRVEGMYGPPLEAFHGGATVVTTPVTGYDEYIEHGVNGLVVGWDDPIGCARTLDLLATDRTTLDRLRTNALRTARQWRSWDTAAAEFASVVDTLLGQRPQTFNLVAEVYELAQVNAAEAATTVHGHKVKAAVDRAHIAKLEAAYHEANAELARVNEENARLAAELAHAVGAAAEDTARANRLDAAARRSLNELRGLEDSRWLALLSALEAPMRRIKPGLGTAQHRVENVRRRLDDAVHG